MTIRDSDSALRAICEGLLAVSLFAFVPVTVRYVSANAITIGLVRLGVAALCVFLLSSIRHELRRLNRRDWSALAGIGLCFALHWLSYFSSIKVSSASIGCISLSTYGVHLVILGWVLQGQRATLSDLVAIGFAVLGTFLLIPEFSLGNNVTLGIVLGVFSGFVYAIMPVIHQRNRHLSMSVRAFGQYSFALLIFLLFLPTANWSIPLTDWGCLLWLAVVCTYFAHTFWVRATTSLSMVTSSIISYLYLPLAVMLSFLLLGETLTTAMVVGATMIIGGNVFALLGQWKRMAVTAKVTYSEA